ncbi:hypothetical protein [Lacrimispora indolis]|uniref:hypothetical protein n=1 Tax=Lacrimispora indolis TaxID=69825 RepID=UPI0004027A6A|nr:MULTISPECIES: hypothetical protein [Lachnospiraceae]
MNTIEDKDAAKQTSLIYGTAMGADWYSMEGEKTVENLVNVMEESVKTDSKYFKRDKDGNIIYGGEMTKEKFLDVIDQIKSSETLMRMEIKDITDNKDTNFRVITLEDPEKDPENKVKPIIVL